MNYIQQAFKFHHQWWHYTIGTVLTILGVVIFSMPHAVAIFFKDFKGEADVSRMDDLNYIMTLFDPNVNLVFLLLPFVGGLIFLLLSVKIVHRQTFLSLTTSRSKIDWKRVFTIFIFWGLFSSGTVLIDYFASPENYVLNFNSSKFALLAVVAIILVPLQTSCEEYLFRGYLMQGIGINTLRKEFPLVILCLLVFILLFLAINSIYSFGAFFSICYWLLIIVFMTILFSSGALNSFYTSRFNTGLIKYFNRNYTPLIITSVVFGLLHISNPEVDKIGYILLVYYIGTGFFLGIMTLMDEGLELALGFHAANNLFTALLVTADWTAFQTYSVFKDISDPTEATGITVLVPVFVLFPILLFILSRVYKWTNWKEKLFGTVSPPQDDYKIIE